MSTIGPIGSSIDNAHARSKARWEAGNSKATVRGFGNRITEAIEQVAEAQNKTAKLVKAYEMGIENDISKVMINQQSIIPWLSNDSQCSKQGAQRL